MKRLFRKLSSDEAYDNELKADLALEDATLSLEIIQNRYQYLAIEPRKKCTNKRLKK